MDNAKIDKPYELVVVPSLESYPAVRLGKTVLVEDTGDPRLNEMIAKATHKALEEAKGEFA